MSDDGSWQEFETTLGGSLIRVYDLQKENIRLDSTTASGYCGITENGLFQWGHTKDYRPDLAQVKIMLSTLDPLGIPIATEILPGNSADDPLYIPAVERVRETLNSREHLYIGDCKMAAIVTRAHLAAGNDYYLCPLSATQLNSEQLQSLLEPVWNETQKLTAPRLRHFMSGATTSTMIMPTEKPKRSQSAMNVRDPVKLLSMELSTIGVNECSWCEVLKVRFQQKNL